MRPIERTLRALVALLVALALVGAVGCGDDDDDDVTGTVPELTVPQGEAETEAQTEPTTTTSESGGTDFDAEKPDSPANDIPPEPDTPEARFEEFCEKHPQACG